MAHTDKRIAIVTGASSGIGAKTAELLVLTASSEAGDFCEIWLIARRREKLRETAEKLEKCETGRKCRVFCGDITDPGFCAEIANTVRAENASVSWFIHSAGNGFSGDFSEIPEEKSSACTELNCTAPVRLTSLLLPFVPRDGRIVMLASAAAFFPQPAFAVYAASKAFLLSFSRALGRELKEKGISVTAVCPGPCDTEFLTLANEGRAMPRYKTFFISECETVAGRLLKSALRRRKLCLPSFSAKLLYVSRKLVPDSVVLFALRH